MAPYHSLPSSSVGLHHVKGSVAASKLAAYSSELQVADAFEAHTRYSVPVRCIERVGGTSTGDLCVFQDHVLRCLRLVFSSGLLMLLSDVPCSI